MVKICLDVAQYQLDKMYETEKIFIDNKYIYKPGYCVLKSYRIHLFVTDNYHFFHV